MKTQRCSFQATLGRTHEVFVLHFFERPTSEIICQTRPSWIASVARRDCGRVHPRSACYNGVDHNNYREPPDLASNLYC